MLKSVFQSLPLPLRTTVERVFYEGIDLLPVRARMKLLYYKSHGRFPNLEHPETYTEKIQVRKLSGRDYSPLVDKILVKNFVAKRCGEDIIIPTLFSGPALPPRRERNWPMPYVIKTNHASGTNIFVTEDPDWGKIEDTLAQFLNHSLGTTSGELFYEKVVRQVLVEPMIGDGKTLPVDYKFFTFNGQVEHIQVDVSRHSTHSRALYSPDWKKLPIVHERPLGPEMPRPQKLSQMLEIARVLGRGFGFIRVDLYEVDGRVYFGELTLTPAAGFTRFNPASYDGYLGSKWEWPDPVVQLEL